MKKLDQLHEKGVSVWLDTLSRDMFASGYLKNWIADGLRGQTSNPTIFQGSVSKSNTYSADIRRLAQEGKSAEEICWELMIWDVQQACDLFADLYKSSGREDGYVSLELDPTQANNTDGSLKQGRELWPRVNRPNLMLKVPATREGIPVVEALLEEGMNINITLLFSVERYEEIILTHMKALENRLAKGLPIDGIASVASFFVSRVDTEAEKRNIAEDLRGKVAVANARAAYAKFLEHQASPRWQALAAKGAQVQRPLWASTGTKNPAYSDVLYVDTLIGPHCVNTMPESTLKAVLDHGRIEDTLGKAELQDAAEILKRVPDLADITRVLEVEGVEKFSQSYQDLLKTIRQAMQELKVG